LYFTLHGDPFGLTKPSAEYIHKFGFT